MYSVRPLGEGTALLAFCAFCWWMTTRFDEVPVVLSQRLPPSFFPQIVLAVLAVLAILMMRQSSPAPPPISGKRLWLVGGAMWISSAAFSELGVVPAMMLSSAVLSILWGERRIWAVSMYAVFFPLAVYSVFGVLLEVRFPEF
ncbi:MAG: tripartite tricarboxylate transporter TctB family protein [Gammaproteobacteria bacterium]